MAIPDYQTILLPLLKFCADGQEHRLRDALKSLSKHFGLTNDEMDQLTPSGQDLVFGNRLGWSRTYLKKAGLLSYPRWGVFQITDAGRDLLSTHPVKVDINVLKNYPSFQEFYAGSTSVKSSGSPSAQSDAAQLAAETPDELIATAHKKLRKQVESELLTNILECSPGYFERLVVLLLTTIGYGGSREDAGQALGRSHDGGIDGEIREDKLGLDTIYIQAKRWQGNVGSREIQAFVGALTGKRAHKGVFITTSRFTREALDFASRLDKKVVLIDGERLAELMFEYGLGVTSTNTYVVKRVDADFFDKDAV